MLNYREDHINNQIKTKVYLTFIFTTINFVLHKTHVSFTIYTTTSYSLFLRNNTRLLLFTHQLIIPYFLESLISYIFDFIIR